MKTSQQADSSGNPEDAAKAGAWVFAQLPADIQLRVLAKLGTDLSALRSFCPAGALPISSGDPSHVYTSTWACTMLG